MILNFHTPTMTVRVRVTYRTADADPTMFEATIPATSTAAALQRILAELEAEHGPIEVLRSFVAVDDSATDTIPAHA